MTRKKNTKGAASASGAEGEAKTQEQGGSPSKTAHLPIKKSAARDWSETILYGLALLMFIKGFIFQNFQIPTSSMENSLLIGDHLTANKFILAKTQWGFEDKLFPFRDIKRGDVLVFKWPEDVRQDYIKRCIGMPGDRFEIVNDQVFINGKAMEEPYAIYKTPQTEGSDRDPENKNRPFGYDVDKRGLDHAKARFHQFISVRELVDRTKSKLSMYFPKDAEYRKKYLDILNNHQGDTIPEGFYLMMGDNRNRSSDSRSWGLVPRPLIQGRAYFVWWSYGEDEGSHKLSGLELIWSYVRVPITIWSRTRLKESFELIK